MPGYFDYLGGPNPVYPIYGQNAVTWPLIYDESVSIVQQIAYIMGGVNQLCETVKTMQQNGVTNAALNAALADQKADYEQQIKALANTLDQKVSDLEANFAADQAAQTDKLTNYTDKLITELRAELTALINSMTDTFTAWDVTQGKAAPSREAMRNMFQWLAVDGLSNEQLAAHTVDEVNAANLTVRGLMTYSRVLDGEAFQPSGCFTDTESD